MPSIKQIGYIHGLLRKADMAPDKEEIVKQYTDGRTTHISEMKADEVQALIKSLGGGDKRSTRSKQERKIISMAHEMGWETEDSKIDMDRLNAWLVKHTKLHLPLNDIPEKDLPGVVSVFSKMYEQFLKTL